MKAASERARARDSDELMIRLWQRIHFAGFGPAAAIATVRIIRYAAIAPFRAPSRSALHMLERVTFQFQSQFQP